MSALTASIQRECLVHEPELHLVPVNSGSVIYAGALVVREAAADVAVPGADTASCVFLGVAVDELDNTSGADGSVTSTAAARAVRVDRKGPWAFAISGSTPKRGDSAYIVDDNTVALVGTPTNDILVGKFLRPAPAGGWYVDIEGAC